MVLLVESRPAIAPLPNTGIDLSVLITDDAINGTNATWINSTNATTDDYLDPITVRNCAVCFPMLYYDDKQPCGRRDTQVKLPGGVSMTGDPAYLLNYIKVIMHLLFVS